MGVQLLTLLLQTEIGTLFIAILLYIPDVQEWNTRYLQNTLSSSFTHTFLERVVEHENDHNLFSTFFREPRKSTNDLPVSSLIIFTLNYLAKVNYRHPSEGVIKIMKMCPSTTTETDDLLEIREFAEWSPSIAVVPHRFITNHKQTTTKDQMRFHIIF